MLVFKLGSQTPGEESKGDTGRMIPFKPNYTVYSNAIQA